MNDVIMCINVVRNWIDYYKWLILTLLGLGLGFILTTMMFHDYSDSSTIFNVFWFGVALFFDLGKGFSGGIFLDHLGNIVDLWKKEERLGIIITLSITLAFYLCCLCISWNSSTAAQLLSEQTKSFDNYNKSNANIDLKKIENSKSVKEKELSNLRNDLNAAMQKDGSLSKSTIDRIDGLQSQIDEQEKIIQEQNTIIQKCNAAKPPVLHGTADALKLEAENKIKTLKIDQSKLNPNISSSQELITTQIAAVKEEIVKLESEIVATKEGKNKTSKKVKKTAIELLFPNETRRRWFQNFISGVLDLGTLCCSFMWTRQRRRERKVLEAITPKTTDNDVESNNTPEVSLNYNTGSGLSYTTAKSEITEDTQSQKAEFQRGQHKFTPYDDEIITSNAKTKHPIGFQLPTTNDKPEPVIEAKQDNNEFKLRYQEDIVKKPGIQLNYDSEIDLIKHNIDVVYDYFEETGKVIGYKKIVEEGYMPITKTKSEEVRRLLVKAGILKPNVKPQGTPTIAVTREEAYRLLDIE